MPRTPPTPFALSNALARRLWLRAQRLDVAAPFGSGPAATAAAVTHLGYVQIDTINVVERCHHQILYTRIPDYRREHLSHAQSVDKTVFEYWTHALSYVPVADMRFFVRAMKHEWRRRAWFKPVTDADLRKVLRRIRAEGPLTIRDIDDDVLVEKDHAWASRKPSKRALQLAFFKGALTVSARTGMLKTYELAGRHFGWDRPPQSASERETMAYRLDRALRAQGFVSLDSVCYLEPRLKPALRRAIAGRVRRGELVPVVLLGADGQEFWGRPEAVESPPAPVDDALVHVLSPFDPLVCQRKRLETVFGYQHRFEAYVPPAKRRFGYFAQPVLVGDEIVAAIDLKADRERRKLLIRKWSWIGGHAHRHLAHRIEEALHRFERFQLAA